MKLNSVKKLKLKIFFFLSLIDFIMVITSYVILPVVMNYPPYAENNFTFQNEVEVLNHVQQYTFVFILATLICYTIISLLMKNIYTFLKKYDTNQHISANEIALIRKDCVNIPYIFYISEITICLGLAFLLMIFLNNSNIFLLKYTLALLAIIALTALLQFIFLQKNLTQICFLTYKKSSNFEKNKGIRIKFSSNLILQIIPFLLVSIIIITLFGYAKTSKEKANCIATYYKSYFDNRTFSDISFESLQAQLDSIPLYANSDYYIILSPNNNIFYTSDPTKKISEFFLAYLDYFFDDTNGIVCEYYGYEQQAYLIDLLDENGNTWYIGFEYTFTDYSLMSSYVVIMIVVSILYGFFIYIWSRNIASNLTTISEALEYVHKENDYTTQKYLPILSNDEFGDLAYSYNKIEEFTNQHLKEIQNNQDMLIEQERLASLRPNDWRNCTQLKNTDFLCRRWSRRLI